MTCTELYDEIIKLTEDIGWQALMTRPSPLLENSPISRLVQLVIKLISTKHNYTVDFLMQQHKKSNYFVHLQENR